MTLVASASILPPLSRSHSVRSNSSGHSFNLGDIREGLDEIEENNTVYVAVPTEVQGWMENLMYLLKSIDNNLLIVFLHVHQPSKLIETPLGPMRPDVLCPQKVNAHRKREEKTMNECLNKYVHICSQHNFKAITLPVKNDDIAEGLLNVIKQYHITDLVMGGGSAVNFCFWRNSRAIEQKPKSRIAKIVRANAESTCRIRFIRKGELICIRESLQNAPNASNLSKSNSGSSPDHLMQVRSQSMPPSQINQTINPFELDHKSRSINIVVAGASFPTGSSNSSFHSGFEDLSPGSSSRRSSQTSDLLHTTPLNYSPSTSQNVTHEVMNQHSSSSLSVNCTEFTKSEINKATKNFDPSYRIGNGGFGAVYRGFLRHTEVAIKILNTDSIQGDPQFFQEIKVLSLIRHPHLVTLIGACVEARALVYEYLPQGSLDNYLTYKDSKKSLPWRDRVRVAREICSALIFLHSSLVVHADLKPENVLLDSKFTVKLSDLGISRQVHKTNITTTPHHVTDQIKGTFSYIDPEYLESGELTPQCDVYSFGIVLLQLVTGKKAINLKKNIEDAIKKDQIEKMVDTFARWPPEQAKKMIQIGLGCSNESRKMRPDLGKDVWGSLESIVDVALASKC